MSEGNGSGKNGKTSLQELVGLEAGTDVQVCSLTIGTGVPKRH